LDNEGQIINKVAASGLITIDLEDLYPKEHIAELDIKDFLYEGIILKEKDFRKSLDELRWTEYSNKILAVFCSEDAVIPKWAYMLVAMYATPFTQKVFFGTREKALEAAFIQNVNKGINPDEYSGKRIVLKGCSDKDVPESVFIAATNILMPVVKSLMYGEPCSTVPIFKRK